MSYVIVDAETCKDAANFAIEQIKQKREKMKEELIQKRMSGWWFPAKTREKAIHQLKNDRDVFSDWNGTKLYGWGTESLAETLLDLAKSGDPVHVSDKHAWMIAQYKDSQHA